MFEVETPGEKSSGVFCCQELFLASSDRLATCQTLFRIPYDIAKQSFLEPGSHQKKNRIEFCVTDFICTFEL